MALTEDAALNAQPLTPQHKWVRKEERMSPRVRELSVESASASAMPRSTEQRRVNRSSSTSPLRKGTASKTPKPPPNSGPRPTTFAKSAALRRERDRRYRQRKRRDEAAAAARLERAMYYDDDEYSEYEEDREPAVPPAPPAPPMARDEWERARERALQLGMAEAGGALCAPARHFHIAADGMYCENASGR